MHFSILLAACTLAFVPITNALGISTSARCGHDFGLTCKESKFGNCCSQYSYCGSTSAYCDKGCQSGFGDCTGAPLTSGRTSSSTILSTFSTRTSSSTIPSSTQKVSTNARCGKEGSGMTCLGSQWGNCCSRYSYCGSTKDYCGTGCQAGVGNCNALSSTSLRPFTSTAQSSRSSSSMTSSTSSISSTTATAPTSSGSPATSSDMTTSSGISSSSSSSSVDSTSSGFSTIVTSSTVSSSLSTSTPIPSPVAPVCTPSGSQCSLSDPGACCSLTCYNGAFNNSPIDYCG